MPILGSVKAAADDVHVTEPPGTYNVQRAVSMCGVCTECMYVVALLHGHLLQLLSRYLKRA